MNTFITYNRLRSSNSVHEVSPLKPSVLYENLKDFIAEFTNAKRYESAHLLLPKQKISKSLAHIITFGHPRLDLYNSMGFDFSCIYYNVNERRIYQALRLLDNEPAKTLSIMWRFKFIDPESGKCFLIRSRYR